VQFEQQFNVPVHSPQKIFAASNPGRGATAGVCSSVHKASERQKCVESELYEVLLDTEWSSAMAPGAAVLVDISDADVDASLLDIITHHPEAKIVTMSFGSCERLSRGDLAIFEPMYAQAAAQGQSVLVATGDDGADACEDGKGASVNLLASDPNVTAVGGTALNPGFDGSDDSTGYVSEAVWNDSGGAGGGGVSTLVAKPAYQDALGVPADGSRDQPDVSLLASPRNAGYVVVANSKLAIIGGTSAAAPSWAGIAALLGDTIGSAGFGSLNPALYAVGREQYGAGGAAAFHDVTRGNNSLHGVTGFAAGDGYDLATGLGTPDVAVLAEAFATMFGSAEPVRSAIRRPRPQHHVHHR